MALKAAKESRTVNKRSYASIVAGSNTTDTMTSEDDLPAQNFRETPGSPSRTHMDDLSDVVGASADAVNIDDYPMLRQVTVRVEKLSAEKSKAPRHPVTKLVSKATWDTIEMCINNATCTLCGFKGSEKRKAKIHVRQHFTRVYCPCGYGSVSRDTVGGHQRVHHRSTKHGGAEKVVYEVEESRFQELKDMLGWGMR
jgi:hypothetical protein